MRDPGNEVEDVLCNKLTTVFSCVCRVIDHEFCHNIIKGAVEPSGSVDYFGNVMTKFTVNNRTEARKTDINLFFYGNKLSNCPLSLFDASHSGRGSSRRSSRNFIYVSEPHSWGKSPTKSGTQTK